jgi:hypothetical protein
VSTHRPLRLDVPARQSRQCRTTCARDGSVMAEGAHANYSGAVRVNTDNWMYA